MAITTVSGYQQAANGAVVTQIMKGGNGVSMSTGPWSSLWITAGNPSAGAIPTTSATCTTATTGAVPFVYPASGNLYITDFTFNGCGNMQGPASILVCDRLSHMGGLSGTNTGSQAVNLSVPGSRGTLADLSNVQWYVECYVQLGSSGQNLTISYTNTSNVSGQTVVVAIPGTMKVGAVVRIVPTIAGDIIQSIDSCTLAGSTGTVGNFGFTNLIQLTLSRAYLGFRTRKAGIFNTGLTKVLQNSCIAFMAMNAAGGSSPAIGSISLGVG